MNFWRLRVNPFALVFACSCIILGCGSDNNAGGTASKKDQKLNKGKPAVIELMTNSSRGQTDTKRPAIPGKRGSQVIEVTPGKAGGPGASPQQVEAAIKAYKKVDPQSIEVIPPRKRGQHGITQREVKALKASKNTVDPQSIEIIPPRKHGQRGMTKKEIDALKSANKMVDPQSTEVIPPTKGGKRGVTQQEINAMRTGQKGGVDQEAAKPPIVPPAK